MLKEFKEFINKGSVIDLAVGLIMATYFGAIVKSFVNDILMPPLGVLIGNVDFKELKIILNEGQDAVMNGETVVTEAVAEVAVHYGLFLNTIITFLIVAFSVFLIVKMYNKAQKKKEEAPAAAPAPPAPSNEEILLTEIRDLLKNK